MNGWLLWLVVVPMGAVVGNFIGRLAFDLSKLLIVAVLG